MRILSRRGVAVLSLLSVAFALQISFPARAQKEVALALDGYDPVAYFTAGEPTIGLTTFELVWDEQLYRFARAEHREMFKADPVRYAPQFANFCSMALTRGELVPADPKSWLISEGRLYIFGKSKGPELFQQGLAGNVDRANQHRDLILKR